MHHRIASARPVGGTVVTALTMAAFTMFAASAALAQQPAQPAKPAAPKPAPKPAAKPAAAPEKPAVPPAGQAAQGPAPEQSPLLYSPWVKLCGKGPEAGAKQVCVVAKDGRIVESGMPVVAVALIEPEGAPQKILRVTVPPGMHLQYGTRIVIDQGNPATAPYVTCFSNGCMADYQATAEMVATMKKGQAITVQAINMNGAAINLPMPLADFAKAYDGPATDPKVFEEQQRKLKDELQRTAEEARKKIEGAQPAATPPAQPPKQ